VDKLGKVGFRDLFGKERGDDLWYNCSTDHDGIVFSILLMDLDTEELKKLADYIAERSRGKHHEG